jgi:cytochrome c-type biogenesis protein CcmE
VSREPAAPTDSAAPPPAGRQARRVRWRYVVAAAVAFGAVAWVLSQGLSDSLVYLRPVSEAVARRDDADGRTLRIGGTVVPGSIVAREPSGVTFDLTEGGVTIAVDHRGDPPDLFDDGAPVVVEGRWNGERFASDRLLIRHGNEYRADYVPPTDGEPLPEEPAGG